MSLHLLVLAGLILHGIPWAEPVQRRQAPVLAVPAQGPYQPPTYSRRPMTTAMTANSRSRDDR